jgi:hypothetical protein
MCHCGTWAATFVPFWQGARGPRALKRSFEFGCDICPSGLHDVFCAENQPINAQFDRNTGNSAAMTFVPPGSGNPRGPYASSRERARFSSEFISALLRDFRQGGPAAIAKVRKYQPAAYMKICALLVPRELKLEHSGTIKSMSDEQIEATIEAIQAMLAAQAGEAAKVIEVTAEPAALPAPNGPSPEAALEATLEPTKRKPNRLMMEVDTAIGPQERKPRKRVPSPAGT